MPLLKTLKPYGIWAGAGAHVLPGACRQCCPVGRMHAFVSRAQGLSRGRGGDVGRALCASETVTVSQVSFHAACVAHGLHRNRIFLRKGPKLWD